MDDIIKMVVRNLQTKGDTYLESSVAYKEFSYKCLTTINKKLAYLINEDEIEQATQHHWIVLNGHVYMKQAESFIKFMYYIILLRYRYSDATKKIKRYIDDRESLLDILECNPNRLHIRLDNGKKCTITSSLLMKSIKENLYNEPDLPKFMFDLMGITYELGKMVDIFKGSLEYVLPIGYGTTATYAFIGDIVYCFPDLAPNYAKWMDNLNTKEKYDIVKGWTKQFEKHKDEDTMLKMLELIENQWETNLG